MSSLQVCVDVRQSPSGRFILRGFCASLTLVTGVPGRTKWSVAPESTTTIFFAIFSSEVLKTVCGMALCFGGGGGWLLCEVDVLRLMTVASLLASSHRISKLLLVTKGVGFNVCW